MPPRSILPGTWPARLAILLVVALFSVPMYFGLDRWDQRNDEAIYSYAVDRILETGDWLTPRAISVDDEFLEKPPLKFWLVAAVIKLGIAPWTDTGIRLVDATFIAVVFLYVFALGRRLAGTIAGLVSAFLVFSYDPLFYWHGVRENQMEGALVLAYCGGMYHFLRWTQEPAGPARRHAFGYALYFVLAFMTKFVAAVFLPLVCAVALALRPGAWVWWRARWREWIWPAVLTVVLVAPWFIYQLIHSGSRFVEIMFTQHVVARFTGTLHVLHLAPWNYYFVQTWREIQVARVFEIVLLGFAALSVRAWIRRDWTARLFFVWWALPMVVLSFGTSKLFYYAHPFAPPLALGGGLAASMIFDLIADRGRSLIVRLGLTGLAPEAEARRRGSVRGRVLMVLGAICFGMAIWTALWGPFRWEVGGIRLFQNGSVARPIFLGAVIWYFAGLSSVLLKIVGGGALVALLPVYMYPNQVERLSRIDHPIRSARDCALEVQASGARVGSGVFDADADIHHAYFYYFRRLGRFQATRDARPDELQRRLEVPGEQTIVMMSADDYKFLGGDIVPSTSGGAREGPVPELRPVHTAKLQHGLPAAATIDDLVVLLFPGPFERCVVPTAEAGARLHRAQGKR